MTSIAPTRNGREILQAGEHRSARVESLRALAALAVASGHAWGIAHGYALQDTQGTYLARIVYGGGFGVFLFFALTGYLLFWPFARRHWGGGAGIDLRRYALNRAVRILPLYYTAVILLLIVQERGASFDMWWRFLLLWQNFSAATIDKVDGVLWSLVVEVHFYILLPFIAVGVARISGRSRARAALALLALGGVSFAIYMWKVQGSFLAAKLWAHNLPATFFFFIPGMLLALLRLEWEERRPRVLDGFAGRSGLWLAGSAVVWLILFARYSLGPIVAVASFLAVGACVLPLRESFARRALDWRPLAAIGVVSYSLYVWHTRVMENIVKWDPFPDNTLGLFCIALPLAVAIAFLSYRLVEEPWLRARRRWSQASPPIEHEPAPALLAAHEPAT
jgi:peptidoglycan/LPS O-acetylase OafA/YrhL